MERDRKGPERRPRGSRAPRRRPAATGGEPPRTRPFMKVIGLGLLLLMGWIAILAIGESAKQEAKEEKANQAKAQREADRKALQEAKLRATIAKMGALPVRENRMKALGNAALALHGCEDSRCSLMLVEEKDGHRVLGVTVACPGNAFSSAERYVAEKASLIVAKAFREAWPADTAAIVVGVTVPSVDAYGTPRRETAMVVTYSGLSLDKVQEGNYSLVDVRGIAASYEEGPAMASR